MDDLQKKIQDIMDSQKMTAAEKEKAIAELQAYANERRQGFKRKT